MHTRQLRLLGALAVLVGGCASSDPPVRATLSPRDFASQRAPVVGPGLALGPPEVSPTKAPDHPPSEITGPIAASEGILDVSASVGDPEDGPSDSMGVAVTPLTLVDGVVGTVNNKAIYINDFLTRMGDRLRAKARELPRDRWLVFARDLIAAELSGEIRDELLLAEARASFVTPEQRAGLSAYLKSLQGDIVSANQGVRGAANQRMLDENGRNIDEEIRFREQRELINLELGKIDRRVTVPFREVRLSYEREYDRFNPPPRAEFHLILIALSKKDEIAAVAQTLSGGADFATVAAGPPNEYRRESGGAFVQGFSGDYATAEFFGNPALNDAAHSLTPGATAGPLTLGDYVWWLHLDRINRTAMSLYDAQLFLEAALYRQLSEEAQRKFLSRLRDRASLSKIDAMVDRLVDAAAERYYPKAGG